MTARTQYDKLWDGLPKDDSGRIGLREFKQLAQEGAKPQEKPRLPAIVPGDGADVASVTQTVVSKVLTRFGSIEKAVESLVLDTKGDCSVIQVKLMLKSCGCTLSEGEFKEFTAALDRNGTGNINCSAFSTKVRVFSRAGACSLNRSMVFGFH